MQVLFDLPNNFPSVITHEIGQVPRLTLHPSEARCLGYFFIHKTAATADRVFERILLAIVREYFYKNQEAKASEVDTTESASGRERKYYIRQMCKKLLIEWLGKVGRLQRRLKPAATRDKLRNSG